VEGLKDTVLRDAIDEAASGFAVLTTDGEILSVNATFGGWIGGVRQATPGRALWALDAFAGAREVVETLRSAVTRAAAGDYVADEIALSRSDGPAMALELAAKPLRRADGQARIILIELRDVTAYRRLTEQSEQRRRFELVGQFAGGIAHDFGNLVTILSGHLELLERHAMDEVGRTRLTDAMTCIESAKALTDRLTAFATYQSLTPEDVPPETVIERVASMADRVTPDAVEIHTDLAADTWRCRCDPAQLESSLLNFVINAQEAVGDRGRIAIAAHNTRLGASRPTQPDVPPGDYVEFTVEDDGPGFDETIIDRAMSPYVTTKRSGGGLGLSAAYGFARQSGGDLVLENSRSGGARARLYAPRAAEAQAG